jgi:hypothetical protein
MSRAEERHAGHRRSAGRRNRPVAKPDARGKSKRKQDPRIQAAWRRASMAKRVLSLVSVMAFGSVMGLSRSTFAGHPKQALRPLSAPSQFVDIVRKNLLQAGLVAPANAPPGAATSVS